MKIFKLFILLIAVTAIGYFSWSYYTSRFHQKKYEKATLVYEYSFDPAELSYWERKSCI